MSLLPRARLRGAAIVLTPVVFGLAACGAGTSRPSTASPQGNPTTTVPATTVPATTMPNTTMPAPSQPAGTAAPVGGAAPVATGAVTIQKFAFGPSSIAIKVGTTMTWTNMDDEAHTVFFAFDGSRSPILVNNANVYHKTFTTPGTFSYHCTIHPFMTGTVEVTA